MGGRDKTVRVSSGQVILHQTGYVGCGNAHNATWTQDSPHLGEKFARLAPVEMLDHV
jgi:hypothetical protein